jgi:FkbM family methyltransferase
MAKRRHLMPDFRSTMSLKSWAKDALRQFGYEIARVDKVGVYPFSDMAKLLPAARVIFDVGANTGQSAIRFREKFPRAEIYSFEPSPSTFQQLRLCTAADPLIHPWNCGLGAVPGRQSLREYENQSVLNSLLAPSSDLWARPATEIDVEIRTAIVFAKNNNFLRSTS